MRFLVEMVIKSVSKCVYMCYVDMWDIFCEWYWRLYEIFFLILVSDGWLGFFVNLKSVLRIF